MKKYHTSLKCVDPTKFGKSISKNYISNVSEDKNTGIITFESKFDGKSLKTLLGLPTLDLLIESDIIEIKVENMGDPIRKIKIDVPILKNAENYERLKVYVNDLKTFKEIMKWSDAEIIFGSLTRSELTELRMCMFDELKQIYRNQYHFYIQIMASRNRKYGLS